MHNIDRTTNEFEFGNEFEFEGEGEFEFEGEGEFEFEGEGEALELELATELLGVHNEQELEQFLGGLFGKVVKGVSNFAKSDIGKGVMSGLKSVAKTALPIVGGALGNAIVPGLGGMIGSGLGDAASSLFELELEGLSNEDREFEVARRYVRFATSAARNGARLASSGVQPSRVVNQAIKRAAINYAPGLLRRRTSPGYPVRGMGNYQPRGFGSYPNRGYNVYPTGGPVSYPVNGPGTYPVNGPATYPVNGPGTYPVNGSDTSSVAGSGTWVRKGNSIIVYGV